MDAPAFGDLAPTLTGRIVRVEPLRRDHEAGLFAAAADPAVWTWMPVDPTADRDSFAGWLELAMERTRAGLESAFCVCDRDGRPIGSTRYLALRPEHRGLEIGWTWITPAAWNSGANAEAKLLLVDHAFERLGCMRVEFKTDARNERSRRALEALGCSFDGIFRRHMVVQRGDIRDSAWYSVIDEDWPAVRDRLRERVERKA